MTELESPETTETPPPQWKRGELWKQLTLREREVCELIALGHRNADIATQCAISIKTIGSHRAAAMKKLGVRNNVELARLAIAEGAVPSP